MRILSIVTLVSPGGEYGGPLRVAVNQATALMQRGHEVTIVAAHRGYHGRPPTEVGGVPARLFPVRRVAPATGFAGLCAPGMLRYLSTAVPNYDIAHVHVARDLVTLPAALLIARRGLPYVLQPHGMIDASSHPLVHVVDPLLTRPVFARAKQIFYLTSTEHDDLTALLERTDVLQHLTNGVPPATQTADSATPEVLFLARLAPRKRPVMLVEAANALHEAYPEHRYRLVGPDEGEGAAVRTAISRSQADVVWEGPLSPDLTSTRMSAAGIYVLPAVDEPYGMSVLEAMAVGLPVVVTDTCGLAGLVEDSGAGLVTDSSLESLVDAIRLLISDVDRARAMGRAGQATTHTKLGMDAIADTLEEAYGSCVKPGDR